MTSDVLFDPKGGGFDAPFEMLDACHDRVRRMLSLLERLQAHLATHGADDQAQHAARDVMRYFDLAAPAHHEDEERHVFPALLQADRARWAPLVERLQADHADMAATWPEARSALDRVAQAVWDDHTQAQAADWWPRFAALYVEHLVAEDHDAYPAAMAVLDAAVLSEMGEEMARRRGLTGVKPADAARA